MQRRSNASVFMKQDTWHDLLEPIVDRYRHTGEELYFRGDAAFTPPMSMNHW